MEEAPENGKESSRSAHADGMNEWMNVVTFSNTGLVQIYTSIIQSNYKQ